MKSQRSSNFIAQLLLLAFPWFMQISEGRGKQLVYNDVTSIDTVFFQMRIAVD